MSNASVSTVSAQAGQRAYRMLPYNVMQVIVIAEVQSNSGKMVLSLASDGNQSGLPQQPLSFGG